MSWSGGKGQGPLGPGSQGSQDGAAGPNCPGSPAWIQDPARVDTGRSQGWGGRSS